MAAKESMVGRYVRAKRAGWDERLTPRQLEDLDPAEFPDGVDLQGVLTRTETTMPPDGRKVVFWFVDGKCADPKTVKDLGPAPPVGNTKRRKS